MASETISGTSYAPFGMGSEASSGEAHLDVLCGVVQPVVVVPEGTSGLEVRVVVVLVLARVGDVAGVAVELW
jgi:hypothetical protein